MLFQILLLALWPISFKLFINTEVAFFSAFFVMMGSMYSYSKLVGKRLAEYGNLPEDDLIDKIDDPYDLYSESADLPEKEKADLKAVIKEEKARIKGQSAKNVAASAPAMLSLYRVIPYFLLILGFIGLKNNDMLYLPPYMAGLGIGVAGGFVAGKTVFGITSQPSEH
jgi:hypothetical protein